MFARVLYVDRDKTLLIDWLGAGKLMVVDKHGSKYVADNWQKQFFLDVISTLERLGQKISPDNIFCKKVLDEFSWALYNFKPDNPAWQAMTFQGPQAYTMSILKAVRDDMRAIEQQQG